MGTKVILSDHLHIRGWDEAWNYPSSSLLEIPKLFPALAPFYTAYENNYTGERILVLSRQMAYIGPVVVLLYGLAVWAGQKYMAKRKAFDLRGPLRFWNLFLAIFSFMGAIRTLPHLLYILYNYNISAVMCSPPAFSFGHGACGLWIVLFVYSKYAELLDTAFIVLRKKPLSFLHWYHHMTVLLFSWHGLVREQPCGLLFTSMNFAVHAVMYFYYYLTASGRKPTWGMLVTVLQISQMVIGVGVTAVGFHYSWSYPKIYRMEAADALTPLKIGCYISPANLYGGAFIYFSYLVLFVKFFVERYMAKPASKEKRTVADKKLISESIPTPLSDATSAGASTPERTLSDDAEEEEGVRPSGGQGRVTQRIKPKRIS